MAELDIPESWGLIGLATVAEIIMGQSPSGSCVTEDPSTGLPLIGGAANLKNGAIVCRQYTAKATKTCKAGDLIIGVRATIGRCTYAEREYCLGRGVAAIRPKIDRIYCKRFLDFNEISLNNSATGSTFKQIDRKAIAGLQIGIPPLAEQKRIVAKIESTTAKIDAIEKAVTEAEALLEKYRESLLAKAFRGELVPQDPNDEPASKLLERIRAERAKQQSGKGKKTNELPPISGEEIPFEIPKSWEWVRLGDLLSVKSGENLVSANQRSGEIPVFGGNGICGYHDAYNTDKFKIIIGRVGAKCGIVHITQKKSWVTDNALIVDIADQAISTDWLSFVLRQIDLNKIANRAAQPVISGQKIYSQIVTLCPTKEQELVTAKLRTLENVISASMNILVTLRSEAASFRQTLLKQAFSGLLVPQDPSEGTGHELLAQIRDSKHASEIDVHAPPLKRGRKKK